MTKLLEVDDLVVRYGSLEAVSGASLHVADGEIVALVGPNGSGKTTLTRTLLGRLKPASGDIRLRGVSVIRCSTRRRLADGMAFVPEGRRLIGELSVEDNLRLGAMAHSVRGASRSALDRVYEIFPRLGERRRQAAGTLSGGEQQMVALGRALVANPKLLVVDEPSLGLAPIAIQTLFAAIGELRGTGVGVLLAEQNATDALGIANRVYAMAAGRIVLESSVEDLSLQGLRAVYLPTT
ncbi:MAG: branched-chain amino acid transport system ATP-binding protein [Gaiellaceae bacterium]|nr:branched-chain amino acid transport system ATP-binding protein [Gaiellaceae bacterium]